MQENDFNSPIDEELSESSIQEPGGNNRENVVGENEDFKKLQSELEEQKDKYIRLFAEFDNYRRRTSKKQLN